jgi:ParB-like chromosome segregation protein Spo0J
MKYHPYSNIWPLLEGEDFEELKADIKANGLRMNLITYQGMLLDGRNRERACEAVNMPARYAAAQVTSDDEALTLVISLNEHRRHLSLEQRAFAAEALATLKNGSNQFAVRIEGVSQEIPSNSGANRLQSAAELIGVSLASVKRARAIRTYGNETDVADVINGKTTLAARAIKLVQNNSRPSKKKPKPNIERRSFVPNNRLSTLKALTREQVDPEFKGTPTEFMDRFGHVQTTTAIEKASAHLNTYATYMRTLMKTAQTLPSWPAIDAYWLDKLREPNRHDIAKLTEALEYLRPLIATAEALLAAAVIAAKNKPEET